MKFDVKPSFARDYQKLPLKIQKQVIKQLKHLLENPHHPSLNIKKMNDTREIWEGRISVGYRFTFQIRDDMYILRKVGAHDILQQP